jgi:hypothetical protein
MCFEKQMKKFRKKMAIVDISLIKLAAFTAGIWFAKMLPQLTAYDHYIYIGLIILFAISPIMKFYS